MPACRGTAKIKRAKDGSILSAELHCPWGDCDSTGDPFTTKKCIKRKRPIPSGGEHGLKYEVEFCCCYSAKDAQEGKKYEPVAECAVQLLRILKKQGDDEESKLIDAYVFCDGTCEKAGEECPPVPAPKKGPPAEDGSWTEDYTCDCSAKAH